MRYNGSAVIDISERIVQSPAHPLHAPNGNLRWHPLRRGLQVACGVLLIALPLTNGMRLDVRRDEFYFAWHRMAAHDLFLLFWVSMLGVAALALVSVFYGRLWCGSVCPQTLASDFADSLKARLGKAVRRLLTRPGRPKVLAHLRPTAVARTTWHILIIAVSIATGLILACYWFAPADVWSAAARPWSDLPITATIYGIAAVLAADMLWVRRRFCSDVCPYGPLMGLLADEDTLTVRYLDERDDDCIHCGKCETDCPMGIDIKQGIMQLSCIGCGECIDSCNDVLGKVGKPGLIELRYGTAPERATAALPLAKRLGLWNKTRYGVLGLCLASLAIVVWLMVGRVPLHVGVLANGAITRDAGLVRNTYSVAITNGTPKDAVYVITSSGVANAHVLPPAAIRIKARDTRRMPVTFAAPAASMSANSRHNFDIIVAGGGQRAIVRTVFFAPES